MARRHLQHSVFVSEIGNEVQHYVELVQVVVFVRSTPSENNAVILIILELPAIFILLLPKRLHINRVGYKFILVPVKQGHTYFPQNKVLPLHVLRVRDGHAGGRSQLYFNQDPVGGTSGSIKHTLGQVEAVSLDEFDIVQHDSTFILFRNESFGGQILPFVVELPEERIYVVLWHLIVELLQVL